jgi:hypothetical protein
LQRIDFSEAAGPLDEEQLPLDVLGDDEDLKMMFRWLARLPAYQADFVRTRELIGDVQDLSRWLAQPASDGAVDLVGGVLNDGS